MSDLVPDGCSLPGAAAAVPALDKQLSLAAARVEWLLQTIRPGLKIVERDGRPQFRLELLGADWRDVSEYEAVALGDSYDRLNAALQKGVIKLELGFDSLRLVQVDAALEVLAPGVFDAQRVEFALTTSPPLLAAVSGQWFPLGVCIDLTPAETNQLIALLGTGAGLVRFLIALGVTAPLAAVIAAELGLAAAAIALAKAMSTTGAVGLKVIVVPPAVTIVPYPI